VQKYLPDSIAVAAKDGKPVTLLSLTTHTSGCRACRATSHPPTPRIHTRTIASRISMHSCAAGRRMRAVGETFEYSNLGVGLLGHALSRRAGKDYEAWLPSACSVPLGMTETRVTLPDAWRRAARHAAHRSVRSRLVVGSADAGRRRRAALHRRRHADVPRRADAARRRLARRGHRDDAAAARAGRSRLDGGRPRLADSPTSRRHDVPARRRHRRLPQLHGVRSRRRTRRRRAVESGGRRERSRRPHPRRDAAAATPAAARAAPRDDAAPRQRWSGWSANTRWCRRSS